MSYKKRFGENGPLKREQSISVWPQITVLEETYWLYQWGKVTLKSIL